MSEDSKQYPQLVLALIRGLKFTVSLLEKVAKGEKI